MDVLLAILILLWIIGIFRKKKGKEGLLKPLWNFIWRIIKRAFNALLYLLKRLLAFLGYFLWKFLRWLAWFVYELIKFLFQAIGMFFRSLVER
jgi:hypothetical protein